MQNSLPEQLSQQMPGQRPRGSPQQAQQRPQGPPQQAQQRPPGTTQQAQQARQVPEAQQAQKAQQAQAKGNDGSLEQIIKNLFDNHTYELLALIAVICAIFYYLYTNDFDLGKIFGDKKN